MAEVFSRMLCSERPEAFGEPSTDQCSASALEDVKVGTPNDIVILGNSSSGLLVHNSKGSAGKLKLRGIVGIKFVNGIIAKEIPKRPDGLLSSLVANRKEDLDLRMEVLDHECVEVSGNSLHTAIFGNKMVSSHKVKPTRWLPTYFPGRNRQISLLCAFYPSYKRHNER